MVKSARRCRSAAVPVDWTTSLAQGQNQPYVWTAGYGIADEKPFRVAYWMLDVDMDCEQAFDDGMGGGSS